MIDGGGCLDRRRDEAHRHLRGRGICSPYSSDSPARLLNVAVDASYLMKSYHDLDLRHTRRSTPGAAVGPASSQSRQASTVPTWKVGGPTRPVSNCPSREPSRVTATTAAGRQYASADRTSAGWQKRARPDQSRSR